tara:strand:- start:3278 stop:3388 length:111 start_codon:yes stop_codon:yes gene_type:complete
MFSTAILVLLLFAAGFFSGYVMAIDIFTLECFQTSV